MYHFNLADIPTGVVIARYEDGQIMGACSYPYFDVVDAFLVEEQECERALIFAYEMGFWRILVEGDSRIVINKIKSREYDKSFLRSIIHYIRRIERNLEEITYQFIHREANMAAHMLATKGRKWLESHFWVEEAPIQVEITVKADWDAWVHQSLKSLIYGNFELGEGSEGISMNVFKI